jgi:uncharacterized protein (DUF2062 family)
MIHWAQRLARRFAAIPESPHEIAKAFAVGVFVGILPGTGPVVALIAAFVFRLSKFATVLGAFTTNPWTFAFVYAASFKIGMWLLPFDETVQWKTLYHFNTGWAHELSKVFPAVMAGGAIVGLGMAFLSYPVVRLVVSRYRSIRLRKSLS